MLALEPRNCHNLGVLTIERVAHKEFLGVIINEKLN